MTAKRFRLRMPMPCTAGNRPGNGNAATRPGNRKKDPQLEGSRLDFRSHPMDHEKNGQGVIVPILSSLKGVFAGASRFRIRVSGICGIKSVVKPKGKKILCDRQILLSPATLWLMA